MTTHGYEPLDTPPVTNRPVLVGSQVFELAETADFPYDDPWSELTRGVVSGLASAGHFKDRDIFEAGIGDARNVFAADFADSGRRLIGVDLDHWRLALAAQNLAQVGVGSERVLLQEGDVVEWLQTADVDQLTGWGLACLPQAPRGATENAADGYQDFDSLARFRDTRLGDHTADAYGLTLNVAYLASLRGKVQPGDFDALVTLSDRVPEAVLHELFQSTGWSVVQTFAAPEPIQQDPDTGVAWIAAFDDGQRFWRRSGLGVFSHITAEEAETKRLESLALGAQAREALNVYHGLSVYHLQPAAEGVR